MLSRELFTKRRSEGLLVWVQGDLTTECRRLSKTGVGLTVFDKRDRVENLDDIGAQDEPASKFVANLPA